MFLTRELFVQNRFPPFWTLVGPVCHHRKDKYERIEKYLVETQDTIELNRTREETVDQSLEFEVSGPSSAAFPSGPGGLVESDRPSRKRSKVPDDSEDGGSDEDESDDGMMGEATSDSEEDDGKTSKTGSKVSGSAKRHQYADEIPEDFSFPNALGMMWIIYIYILVGKQVTI